SGRRPALHHPGRARSAGRSMSKDLGTANENRRAAGRGPGGPPDSASQFRRGWLGFQHQNAPSSRFWLEMTKTTRIPAMVTNSLGGVNRYLRKIFVNVAFIIHMDDMAAESCADD